MRGWRKADGPSPGCGDGPFRTVWVLDCDRPVYRPITPPPAKLPVERIFTSWSTVCEEDPDAEPVLGTGVSVAEATPAPLSIRVAVATQPIPYTANFFMGESLFHRGAVAEGFGDSFPELGPNPRWRKQYCFKNRFSDCLFPLLATIVT